MVSTLNIMKVYKTVLDKIYPDNYTLNEPDECDYENLKKCLIDRNADILIISNKNSKGLLLDSIADGVEYAMQNKIQIMFAPVDGNDNSIMSGLLSKL